MPRGVTCGGVTKATSVGQTRERKGGEEKQRWCLWRVITLKCALVCEAEDQL